MSRSYRKTKIFGNCGNSEKKDKRINNRIFRRKEKLAIKNNLYPPKNMNEIRNVWEMSKDGKSWWNNASKKDLSK